MGMKFAMPEDYKASIKKLFPQGEYWDKQFANINSDCSLFVQAKIGEFVRFRNRMSDLQNESVMQTARETLESWERVYLGKVNWELSIEQRRTLLSAAKSGNINRDGIKEIGRMYGTVVSDVKHPFRSAFFGHAYFGISQICSPASFSTLFIYATPPVSAFKDAFEAQIVSRLLANNRVFFVYGGA